jgi:ketosteroid isomerase-like protein
MGTAMNSSVVGAYPILGRCSLTEKTMTKRAWWILSWGLVLVAAVSPSIARTQSKPDDAAESVAAVLDRQVADWNRGDLDAFLTGYWNSPKVVFQSGGQRLAGWEAMRDRYRRRYQAEGRAMGKLVFSSIEIESLCADAALVRGAWRLTMADGTKPGGLFTLIFRKLPEGWKIVHDHTSAEEPAKKG